MKRVNSCEHIDHSEFIEHAKNIDQGGKKMSEAITTNQETQDVLRDIHYRMMYVHAGFEQLTENLDDLDHFGLAGIGQGLSTMLKNELDRLEHCNLQAGKRG